MTKKKIYTVEKGESIDQCLKRMEQEGYRPVRRMEEPIFQEIAGQDGNKQIEVVDRRITFEGKSIQ